VTHLTNAARLRIKESDRLAAVTEELNKLGAQVEEHPDGLTIRGVDHLHGGTVDAHNDHRIAMMLAIAATRADAPVTIVGGESVNKSYPNFWEDYESLGGKLS
jgi:3-phosphoshikimate 1-carboxyvinyltransferase